MTLWRHIGGCKIDRVVGTPDVKGYCHTFALGLQGERGTRDKLPQGQLCGLCFVVVVVEIIEMYPSTMGTFQQL